jgi:hypothetical protein
MRIRKIFNKELPLSWGESDAEELQNAIKLSVITKCPEKYLLIDKETGQVYQGTNEDNPYMPNYKLWKAIK